MNHELVPKIDSQYNEELCIQAHNLGKCYRIYNNPKDRLKQALWGTKKKYYREFWALRNFDLEIKKGDTLAILGQNGSGKSTLLKMICGTLTPTEGSIYSKGRVAALLELGSGFNPEFTGIENIFLNASLLGLSKKQVEERLDDIRAFADIGDFVNQPIHTYSSGMVMRLAFAVIAHVEASVLIVDEALSVGDAVFGQRCMRFIRKFKEKGTLLFVSHDLNAVSSLCESCIWVDSGRLMMKDETKTIVTAYTRYCQDSTERETMQQPSVQEETDNKTGKKDPARKENNRSTRLTTKRDDGREFKDKTKQYNSKPIQKRPINADYNIKWDETKDYGNKNAIIEYCHLRDEEGYLTNTPECGKKLSIEIGALCKKKINNFMAGFIVRDRTGLLIWGDNNIDEEIVSVQVEDRIQVKFEFTMPFVSSGDYSISVAVSEGDPSEPTVAHYKPDVAILRPLLGNRTVHGVFAASDMTISVEVE